MLKSFSDPFAANLVGFWELLNNTPNANAARPDGTALTGEAHGGAAVSGDFKLADRHGDHCDIAVKNDDSLNRKVGDDDGGAKTRNVNHADFVPGEARGTTTGTVGFANIKGFIPCFTPGTVIATSMGERLVENLKIGDRIITRDNGLQKIRWVGKRDLTGKELTNAAHLKPVLIRAGALGHALPERDMLVSPQHRILVNNEKTALYFGEREVLAAAKHLTSLEGIDRVEVSDVTYVHFMFDHHEVVLSNGAWTESFQPGSQVLDGMRPDQQSEIFDLFPELRGAEGLRAYRAARRSLKKHEARLLAK